MKPVFVLSAMIILAISFVSLSHAVTVTIGDLQSSSTTSYFPINCYYDYSYTQQIYTQAQIGRAGEITKLRFNYYSGNPTNSSSWVIYLGHTSRTNFPSLTTAWIPSSQMTQVFSGTVVYPGSPGWMEIVLNTPFQYNNTDNLVVAVDENSPNSSAGSVTWQGFSSSLNAGIYHYSNTVNANPASPPYATNTNAFLSEIQLVFTDTDPPNPAISPSPTNLATDVDAGSSLSWQFDVIEGQSYDVYLGTSSPPPFIGNQTSRIYNPGLMQYETTYYWQIVPRNQHGPAQNCPIWSFTTWPDPTIYTFPYAQGFNATTFPPLGWKQTLVSGNYGFMRYTGTGSRPTVSTNFEGAARVYYPGYTMDGNANCWLATPEIAMQDNTKQYQVSLAFWKDSTSPSTGSLDRIELYLNSTQNLSGSPTLVGTIHRTKSISPAETGADGWYQYRFDLGAGTGQTKYLIIKAVNATWNGYGNGMNIDLLQILEHSATTVPQQTISPRPVQNATNQSIRPGLRWENGGGLVSGYRLYVGDSPESLQLISEQSATSFTYSSNLPWNSQMYWRVDSYNANGTTIGEVWSFNTETPSIQLTSPSTNSTGAALNTLLNWADITFATGYKISVGTSSGATDIADKVSCSQSQWANSSNWLFNQSYYWKVYAMNGEQEQAGAEWTFSTLSGQAQISSPSNGQSLVNLTAALQWQAVTGATGYLIDVGTSPGATDIANRIACENTRWQIPTNWNYSSTYYWRVYVLNGSQEISGSLWSFSTVAIAFGNPTPANNASNVALNQVLDWEDIAYVSAFKIKIGTSSGASDIVDMALCESSQWTPPSNLLFGTTYYWQVFAISGEQESPGPEWTFSTLNGLAQITAPSNGQTLVTLNALLDWQAVSGATGYLIDVGTSPGGTDIANRIACEETAWQNPVYWHFSTTYYWRVYTLNGSQEVAGSLWSFSTISANFGTPAPANNATNVAINTILNWQDISYVSTFKIKIGTSSGAGDIVDMALCESSQWTPPSNLLYGTTYFWRVYAINGEQEVAGPEWKFSTAVGQATSPSPANNATNVSIFSKVLTWTAVANASAYQISAGTTLGATDLVNAAVVSTNRYTHPQNWPSSTTVYWKVTTLNGSQEVIGLPWTFSTVAVASLPYSENFDSSSYLPSGWSGNMYISATHGANGTNGMYEYLINYDTVTVTTGLIGPLTNSVNLEFDYRFMTFNGYPATAYNLLQNQYLEIRVSANDGATYNTLHRIDRTNHTATTNFTKCTINLNQSGFVSAGSIVRIRFFCLSSSDIFYLDIDNVKLSSGLYAPDPITPSNNSQNVALDTYLDWSDVDLATSYRINVGTSPGATDIANAVDCAGSEWSFSSGLSYNQNYYWQVTAINSEAEFVAPEWNFRTIEDVNDINGYSISLNGSNQYINCGNPPAFNSLSAITLEAWIYPTNFQSASHRNTIIGKDFWGAGPNEGFVFRYGSSNRTLDFVMSNGSTGWNVLSVPGVLTLNTWQHVAASYDGSFMRLFVNGTQVGSLARSGVIPASSKNLLIGTSPADARYMYGFIDEVRIWNVARSQQQISANRYAGLEPQTNLIAYYRMTNGNGSILSDNSSSGNTATSVNNPLWSYQVPIVKPPAPLATAATSITTSGFTANWNAVQTAAGYRLDVSSTDTFSSFVGVYNDLDIGSVLNYAISGLSAGTTYYYRIRSVNASGTGVSSNTISTTTKQVFNVSINTGNITGVRIYTDVADYGIDPQSPIILPEGFSGTFYAQKTNYIWTLATGSDTNVINNLSSNRSISFVGTFSYSDPVNPGFIYSGSPNVIFNAVETSLQDLSVPLPYFLPSEAVVILVTASNSSDVVITVPIGTWYVIAYYDDPDNGGLAWHHADPYPAEGPGSVSFYNVPFGAKSEVPLIISREDATLPIELSSFSAVINSELYVSLSWTTQSETNLSGFALFRSTQNSLATAISVSNLIPASNTSQSSSYTYIDMEAEPGASYFYWLLALDMDGSMNYHGPIFVIVSDNGNNEAPEIPLQTRLLPSYPNPFNPSTTIRYDLKSPETVNISIYNSKGQRVYTYHKIHNVPGIYYLKFDAVDMHGKTLSSGLYFCVMSTGKMVYKTKMVLLK